MKTNRQEEILQIIREFEIETQEDLANMLRLRGYKVTQATVSRDIKELQLIKVAGQTNAYRYALPGRRGSAVSERMIRILSDSTVSIQYAGQMVVVKTLSGSANVACEAIDSMEWPEIMGSIAGDNTIFLAMRNEADAAEVAEKIRKLAGKD